VKIAISSGKGGTGKTFVATNMAFLADEQGEEVTYLDCDVEEPNGHLFLKPVNERTERMTVRAPVHIDPDKCTQCGRCKEVCRFSAVQETDEGGYVVDQAACGGCGACDIACPVDVISSEDAVNGKWFVSRTRFGPMSHAILGHAEENSGRLVTLVRNLAVELAAAQPSNEGPGTNGSPHVMIDGSPGTGCPVIASVSGARYAVIVAEPTVSGLHDLLRVLDLTRHFGVLSGVIVNKADLNDEMTERIEEAARKAGAGLLGTIPYDNAFTEAQICRETLLERGNSPATKAVRSAWRKITEDVLAGGTA